MSTTQITVVLEKSGATFASEAAANADRFNGYPEVFGQAIEANQSMANDGIFAAPIARTWNQSTFTLTFVKLITDVDSYHAIWDPIEVQVRAAETANGWTQVSSTTVAV